MNKLIFENKSYKISVIVPVYNVEGYVSQCVESIIGQTYTNLQIILVDDGSTDSSGRICDTYAEQDDRIQVIHQANEGLVSSRKAGLNIAEGDFIGFVDGDDYIEPEFYESLLNFLLKDQVDFVHTGYIYKKHAVFIKNCQFETKIYKLCKDAIIDILNNYVFGSGEEQHIAFSTCTKLYRSEFIKKCYNRVPHYQSMGEDLVCLCVCLLEGKGVSFHKEALYYYNLRDSSLVNSVDMTIIPKNARLYSTVLDMMEVYGVAEQVKPSMDRYFVNSILTSLTRGCKAKDFINAYVFDRMDLIKDKKLVIYGAGIVGQGYYAQICKYTSCTIVGWVDLDYKNIHFDYSEVVGVEKIKNMQYDLVLIAVKRLNIANEIRGQLRDMGVPEQKIVWEKPRSLV